MVLKRYLKKKLVSKNIFALNTPKKLRDFFGYF